MEIGDSNSIVPLGL